MKTAVVILNWNGKHLLEKFLPGVVKHSSAEALVYVVDNASTDDSVAFLQANFPEVRILQNKENFGFAKGYNEALKQIEADVFVLLNSDVEVTEGWLQESLYVFSSQPDVAALQPKILDFKNKNLFEYAGAAGGYIDKFGFPYCRGRIFFTIEEDKNQYDDSVAIFWASGACFFVKSEKFWEAGGFDEDYFAHQEEIDLCWRLNNLGYSVIYTPHSQVYHVGGATLQNNNPQKTYLNFRNSLYTLLKNIPSSRVFQIVLARLIIDGFAGIRFLFHGKFLHCFAIIKAHFHFYFNLSKMWRKRVNSSKRKYYKTKSIIFSYFFKQRKYFYKL